jgi:hypothetical protein
MKFRSLAAILFMQIFLTNCGPAALPHEETQSMLHFIPFSTTNGISLRHAREPVFKICAQGQSNAKVEEWAVRAALTWLKASRTIDDKVTNKAEISCSSPHININMRPGQSVSFASPGNVNFFTGQKYGELLHELGHALAGLSDTYVGRQAGACKPGQPQSNMCWGAFGPRANPEEYSGLWADDIEGVQSQHKKLFPDATPPANAAQINAETPVDANNPWPEPGQNTQPGITSTPDANTSVWAALEESTTDLAKMYLSAPTGTQATIACPNVTDATQCQNSFAKISFQAANLSIGRPTFVSTSQVTITADQTWYAFATDSSGQVVGQQGFRFNAK